MKAMRSEVFVVDDDASVRAALARLIQSAGHAVQTFESAEQFLRSGSHLCAGCLVLDIRLPDVDGLELYRQLRESGASLPVIFMTGFGDITTGVEAIKSGALDFLPKPVADETLLGAIETALEEDARLRAERAEAEELMRRYRSLTPREAEVMGLVVAGRLNKQIALELGISEKTVKVHRGRLMAKMGARRVAHLVRAAVRLDLAATPPRSRPPHRSTWLRRRPEARLDATP